MNIMLPVTLSLVVFAVSLWRPRFGLAGVILLWPAYLLRASIFVVPTTALELSIYAVLLATLILFFARRLTVHWITFGPISWSLLGLWILAWIIATAASSSRTASFGALKAWLIDPLIFSALLVFLIRTAADRLIIVKATLLSGTAVALFGLYQMLWLRQTLQDGRLSSFFHPVANYAAMFLAPIAVFGLGLLLHRFLRGGIWWLMTMVIVVALGLTLSYGGYLALAAGGVIIWWFLPSSNLKRRLAIGAVGFGTVAIVALSTTRNFAEHFNTVDRSSGLVRQQIWVTSWALIKQHPLVGIGPNAFETAYRAEIPKHYFPPLEWLVAQPHNLYLALWLETGLLGLVAFVVPIIRHVYLVRRRWLADPRHRAMAVASLAALLAVLAHGFVDTPYFKNDLALEYMLMAIWPWLGTSKFLTA